MSEVTNTLMTSSRFQNNDRKLPPSVRGMGQLMVQVLAQYGLEIVEGGGQLPWGISLPCCNNHFRIRDYEVEKCKSV